jgi:hypothetical protein
MKCYFIFSIFLCSTDEKSVVIGWEFHLNKKGNVRIRRAKVKVGLRLERRYSQR